MPRTTSKKPTRGQTSYWIDDAAVLRTVRLVMEEAERTLDAALAAAKTLGLLGRDGWCVSPVPIGLLLKLGAMMRIRQWEEADLVRFLRGKLPSADDVEEDARRFARGRGGKYHGPALALRVFRTWYRQMAHSPLPGGGDVVINEMNARTVLTELSKFLWQNRHIAIPGNQEVS